MQARMELTLKRAMRWALMAVSGLSAASAWAEQETVAPVAQMATCGKPEYPRESIDKVQEGTVVLAFLIGTDGTVKRSEIKKSSGFPALDTAAVEALRLCHFKPGLKDGQPLEVWAPVAYVWSLGTRSVVPPGVPPVVPLAQNVPPY